MAQVKKEKQADGSIWYTKMMSSGKEGTYKISAEKIARDGEAVYDKTFGVDGSPTYTPSAYSHPAEYAHLYDSKAGIED